MNTPARAAAAALALLLAAAPAPAAGWRDEELGVAVSLGEEWTIATSTRDIPGERLGRPAAEFRRDDAVGWLFLYGNAPNDPVTDPRGAARTLAHLVASRYEPSGERLVPGFARPAALGTDSGVLLEFEVAAAGSEARTRVGRAVVASRGGRWHLLAVERPAAGAGVEEVAALEELALSLRLGPNRPGERPAPPAVDAAPPATGGDRLPDPEFRSAVEIERILAEPEGLEILRQYYLFEGGKLPAYVTHLMGKEYEREGRRGKTPDLLLLMLNNTKGKEARKLRAELQLLDFSEAASRTVEVPAGGSVAVALSPVFGDALYDLAEQRPGAVRLRLYDVTHQKEGVLDRFLKRPPGKLLHESTERITILGPSDFFWRDGTGRSWAPALLTLVTPHDRGRRIDALLRRAIDHCAFGAMLGYQEVRGTTRPAVVREQAKAVYEALAAPGYTYVNAPVSMDARAQRIKLPGAVLEDRSGNCIETTLVFAAAFEAMGMRPVVVLYEDHAQVAVRAWEDDPALLVLETTLCGRGSFADAAAAGEARYRAAAASKSPPELVDVREWRRLGFTPVPR
jgi:hypothetical protein